jgi:hypothetical protein
MRTSGDGIDSIRFTTVWIERQRQSVAEEDCIEYRYLVEQAHPTTRNTSNFPLQWSTSASRRLDAHNGRYPQNGNDDDFEEVQLAVPVEDFLSYRWDWRELKAFLYEEVKPKLLWLTERAFLVVDEDIFRFHGRNLLAAYIGATSGEEHVLILVQMSQSDAPIEGLNVFWRAVATSNSVRLKINNDSLERGDFGLPSGPLLSQFLRESSLLEVL